MQLLGLAHYGVLVSVVVLGEVEDGVRGDGAVAEEGRAGAEVLLRAKRFCGLKFEYLKLTWEFYLKHF